MTRIRCAIYTRKSSEEGLDQAFNSLHAQREACAAYIESQKHEGWGLLSEHYDDGGLSGGTLERPALQRLLEDMREGRVDRIVVYKIDRLTRSLADFAKIVDVLDAAGASFVSVTQSFNTATSMGRLTLNMLLSFAQFEREVTAERIRDKIAASKRKGLWMGGLEPLGYRAEGRTLVVAEPEAKTVRQLYALYERHCTIRAVKREADRLGLRSRVRTTDNGKRSGGGAIDRGHIHHILTNPIYAGRIRHRDRVHDGQHPAIIDPARWEAIQATLQAGARRARGKAIATRKSRLCGKLFDEAGDRLTPTHTRMRNGTRRRYYVSHGLIAGGEKTRSDGWRLPGEELERKIAAQVGCWLADPSISSAITGEASAQEIAGRAEIFADICKDETKLLALISRIDITAGNITIALDRDGIGTQLGLASDAFDLAGLTRSFPFQRRRRGVETKIILADEPGYLDEALIRNIAKAHLWFERIVAGDTYDVIATGEGISKRRVQQMIDLAFLAPDIVRDVLDGKLAAGFTSDWCKTHAMPSDWEEQRKLIATL